MELAARTGSAAGLATNTWVTPDLAARLLWLPDRARSMGTHIVAGKGAGKSRLMGRVIAWQDFRRGIPLVLIDPHGPSIDNFLDKLARLPRADQEQLWRRVLYVDMSGSSGYVVPLPLYYRLGDESLYIISQRYLDTVRRIDPFLQTASVEGWNALWRVGTHVGIALAAMGLQITEAENLVRNPERWAGRLAEAAQAHPEAMESVVFFKEELVRWDERTRASRTDSFLNKTAIFRLDPAMRAMFGAREPGISWQRVVDQGYAVLIDFRGEHDLERLRFKMIWLYNYLLEFIRRRGPGRHKPISLIIDELTYLLQFETLRTSLLAQDLDELINRIARNYSVWLTLCHQEMYQLPETIQKTLMTMGTQILGVTTDTESAVEVARRFVRFDPQLVKKYEPVYNSSMGVLSVIDYRSVEFSIEEQELLNSFRLLDLSRYHFLVSSASVEGTPGSGWQPVSIEGFDRKMYVDEVLTARARELLMARRGRLVSELLLEIEARQKKAEPTTVVRAARVSRKDNGGLSG